MKPVYMTKGRLEAFSDGVFAIIITIMVLELKAPPKFDVAYLTSVWPVFVNYVISFIYVGIYWNNHHHMFQAVRSINGAILWANLHLLFWLSLVPFVTDWMGESHFSYAWPIALYGVVLLCSALAFTLLVFVLIRHEGDDSTLATALGSNWKSKISILIYCIAIGLSCVKSYISFGMYIAVACIWFIPDKRIENKLAEEGAREQ